MARSSKPLPELRQMLAQCLLEVPGCGDCELRAVCVHRPDHTGCNWSAEVDFPARGEEEAVRDLPRARRVIVLMRERYNVVPGSAA
ncbi:hypothetical protein BKK79_25115 [Cupriavidus sp. USMAA2-4]|uniref:Uncharacterized protein n=1 Tax=Cupriavidus malaysiensis TaxID=367825 RepID=A0ABM6FFE8_9BURK|nr:MULTISPECIES: hypothetical protein [Cupriavidus]AOY95091.1 hypothetical protein BKK79_25115 [Cupriavidus sp. USMAA2-4]AOZ02013.1 hypothetical protein BKK81_21980 [Cupriavidus sp. USMAHM13]AOZ10634.1 hypothetical protein BKK80_34445 [Cupriavidus malaysiensis]